MNRENMYNAIRSRFKTQVADKTAGLVVIYDNAPFTDSDVRWVRFTIKTGDTTQRTIGAQKTYRTIGIAIAQIFVPVDQGDRDALQLADTITAAFRSVTDQGVRYQTPSTKNVGRTDQWWQVNVTCPFFADEIGA
jgi:hypothetical protein